MAAASTSTAAIATATAVSAPRFPIVRSTVNYSSSLLCLPTNLSSPPSSFSSSLKLISDYKRNCVLVVKVNSSDDNNGEIITDLKEKWEAVENKSTVFIYGTGTLVALWLATILVSSIDSLPLLPKILELIGLGYTVWFVYRYLLFKSSRKELGAEIEGLKKKIVGTE